MRGSYILIGGLSIVTCQYAGETSLIRRRPPKYSVISFSFAPSHGSRRRLRQRRIGHFTHLTGILQVRSDRRSESKAMSDLRGGRPHTIPALNTAEWGHAFKIGFERSCVTQDFGLPVSRSAMRLR